MRTVAEEYDRVVGVDTHAATHTMTLLIGATGARGGAPHVPDQRGRATPSPYLDP